MEPKIDLALQLINGSGNFHVDHDEQVFVKCSIVHVQQREAGQWNMGWTVEINNME